MADFLHTKFPDLLWCVPLLPLAAGGLIALLPNARGKLASRLAIGALLGSLVIALGALVYDLTPEGAGRGEKVTIHLSGAHAEADAAALDRFAEASEQDWQSKGHVFRVANAVEWFRYGAQSLKVGVVLDPLSAGMGAMVAFVAFWIFLYSTSYMKDEARFGRFFGFLSLFCGAMLMVVYANSLLLLFMAWEIVGLASYLLIGFYYEKPSAAKAAQKAFITTRCGDVAFFIGMIWLHAQTGTLLFYDGGNGLLENEALQSLAGATTVGGLTVSAAASLLLLLGAMGKSGQVPLHVWLPDAMEGPTPVSALIHAATMVAAGVYMVARCFPIFDLGESPIGLQATAWVGAITALYAAVVAVAQYDFKRILAYSTVSQLGFMMVALGTGGMAAGMLHLICHAFFKALLFLSAGSVIHGCHGEQDIRKMGGLGKPMRRTFIAYAIGMMALSGFPFLFSGFWSKEAVLHSAMGWSGGKGPFVMTALAAVLTAFYMMRQLVLVFTGKPRDEASAHAHESAPMMLVPLYVLAAGAVLLSLIATPFWPWYEKWLSGEVAHFDGAAFSHHGALPLLLLSLGIVTVGATCGWLVYRNVSSEKDPLASKLGVLWTWMERSFGFDAFYEKWVIAPLAFFADGVKLFERGVMVGSMAACEKVLKHVAGLSRITDERGWNAGFDALCSGMKRRARCVSQSLSGKPQSYLYGIGLGLVALLVIYAILLHGKA